MDDCIEVDFYCYVCRGTGEGMNGETTCTSCNGSGMGVEYTEAENELDEYEWNMYVEATGGNNHDIDGNR